QELNGPIIDKIYNEQVIIEHSPPEGIPFGKLLSGASVVTIGTYVGFQGIVGGPLLFLAVAAGILAVGAPIVMLHVIDKGLIHRMERAMGTKDKTTPPAGSTTTSTTRTRRRKAGK